MKRKHLIVLVLIAFFLIHSCAQRGGGRRSFGRRRGGRSSFPLFGSRSSFRSSKNSTCIIQYLIEKFFINSTAQNSTDLVDLYENETSQTALVSSTTFMVLSIFAISYCIFICRKGKLRYKLDKENEVKRILEHFQTNHWCDGPLNESLVYGTLNWFVSTKWKVQVRIGFHGITQSWNFKIDQIIKKTVNVYDLKAQGFNDVQGEFNIKGILHLRNRDVDLCFIKQISKKTPHIKKGKLGLIIYRAHSDDHQIYGKWNYDGFRQDSRYSGRMTMTPLT